MTTRDEILNKQTHKDDGLDVERRVFYTLIGDSDMGHRNEISAHRVAKAVALLFKTLHESGTISEAHLDDILLNVVM